MDKDSYWGQMTGPLEYRLSWSSRIALVLGTITFGFITAFMFAGPTLRPTPIISSLYGCIGACGAIYFPLYLLRGFIRITPDRIDYRCAFKTISMRRDEVVGKKQGRYGNRPYLWLVSMSGRVLQLDGVRSFNVDRRFDAWLDAVPRIETPLHSKR